MRKGPMTNLSIMNAPMPAIDPDELAHTLGRDPEALAEFESRWQVHCLESPETDDESITSHLPFLRRKEVRAVATPEQHEAALELADAIVANLTGAEDAPEVTPADVAALPLEVAPQTTHDAMRYDVAPGSADRAILTMLAMAKETDDPSQRRFCLAMARQGLDILDIDPLVYEMLSADPVTIGHWFPTLERACDATEDVLVPTTRIVRAPATLLQLSRTLEPGQLNDATRRIVNEWAKWAFDLKEDGDYFVKTGSFSSKYDFRNAHVRGSEVAELGEYLLYLSQQAVAMASPLTQPAPIIGVSTTNEWVVRDYVTSADDRTTIYHGMPLRVEFRCFLDLDEREVLGVVPYWDPDTMEANFRKRAAQGDETAAHDYVSFVAWWQTAREQFERLRPRARAICESLMGNGLADLGGQWSLDLMRTVDDEGNELMWAIDMAPAHRSALADRIDDPRRIRDAGDPDWAAALPA